MPDGTVINYVNSPGCIVEVVISGYPWNSMVPTGFMPGTGLTLRASSTDVLEGLAAGSLMPPNP